jgi:hypothetical protein
MLCHPDVRSSLLYDPWLRRSLHLCDRIFGEKWRRRRRGKMNTSRLNDLRSNGRCFDRAPDYAHNETLSVFH